MHLFFPCTLSIATHMLNSLWSTHCNLTQPCVYSISSLINMRSELRIDEQHMYHYHQLLKNMYSFQVRVAIFCLMAWHFDPKCRTLKWKYINREKERVRSPQRKQGVNNEYGDQGVGPPWLEERTSRSWKQREQSQRINLLTNLWNLSSEWKLFII